MRKGYVFICGAGCGDADLITIRGMNALKSCDAVIYDALIDERLLDFAPEGAEKLCVGKRAGRHSEKQENINELIAAKALDGKCVVRLKGGDPLVFGRGGEEAQTLEKYGIAYEFIPGITSAAAVPELAGIPVTHRNVSRSFHVITGHTADDTLPENMAELAKLSGTLIFLMGLRNLDKITRELINYGKSPDTPAAVISNGGRENQSIFRGVLSDIGQKAQNAAAPAVILVGETAAFSFGSKNRLSVSLVGTEQFTSKLSQKLSPFGIKTEAVCRLAINEYMDNTAFDDALENISDYTVTVFTSANAVRIFFDRMRRYCRDIRGLSHLKFAAIGRGTAHVLSEYGIYADIIPQKYTSAELGKMLAQICGKEDNILIPRAQKGSAELTSPLDKAGINYNEIRIYDVCVKEHMPRIITSDCLVFGSASGVKCFFDCGYSVSEKTDIICIGEITAKALEDLCGRKCIISETCDTDGIAEILLKRVRS